MAHILMQPKKSFDLSPAPPQQNSALLQAGKTKHHLAIALIPLRQRQVRLHRLDRQTSQRRRAAPPPNPDGHTAVLRRRRRRRVLRGRIRVRIRVQILAVVRGAVFIVAEGLADPFEAVLVAAGGGWGHAVLDDLGGFGRADREVGGEVGGREGCCGRQEEGD